MYSGQAQGGMTVTITTRDQDRTRTYTGHVMSRTNHTLTLLLTEPFSVAGQNVTLLVRDVISEQVLVR